MKKSKIIVFAVIFSLFLMCSVALSEENSNVLYVDDDGEADYTYIQDAIDDAVDGDTIFVYNGLYQEALFVNKSINLIGENKEETIISGGDFQLSYQFGKPFQNSSALINLLSDDIKVYGFTIKNSTKLKFPYSIDEDYVINLELVIDIGVGIKISSNNNTISDNIIENNGADGIIFSNGASNNILSNNKITNNGERGIYLENGSKNQFVNNTIKDNKLGIIFLENSYENIFYHNNFINSALYHTSDNGKNIFYSEELKEGNYWDDHNSTDKDNDGICDIAYNTSSTTQDKYPLMNPYMGRIIIKDFYVDEFSVQMMLVVGMIAVIIFCIPIGLWWRKKYFK